MGNTELSNSGMNKSNSDPNYFDYQIYMREGITQQDVMHIRQAFENLRDENDRPNEVKLSKLKLFPFFNKQDIARLPRDGDRIKNQQQIRAAMGGSEDQNQQLQINANETFSGRNIGNIYPDVVSDQNNSHIESNFKMESKGIDCQSIMCGCNNTKTIHGVSLTHGIRDTPITFDQFFEIMSEKISDSRPHSNIIFESKVSNVSCFLWPIFGTQ